MRSPSQHLPTCSLLLLFGAASALPARAQGVYDAGAEWSDVSNPTGPWSYEDSTTPIAAHRSDWNNPFTFPSAPQPVWAYAPTPAFHHVPAWLRVAAPANPNLDLPVGCIALHTSDACSYNANSWGSLVWTAPTSGVVTVSGDFWHGSMLLFPGRELRWRFTHQNSVLASGTLLTGNTTSSVQPVQLGGTSTGITFAVAAGDRVALEASTLSGCGSWFVIRDYAIRLDPTIYCTSGTTSNGCNAIVSASGLPSASTASGFVLECANVEGQKAGLFFYGLSGPLASPWSMGSSSFLCVKAPTQRMSTLNSGGTSGACDGFLSEDWSAYLTSHPAALGLPFAGGETVWSQAWFRDPAAPKTTNLSNALRFTVLP